MMKSHSPQHAESLDQLQMTAQSTLCLVLLQMKLIMLIMLVIIIRPLTNHLTFVPVWIKVHQGT